MLDESCSRESVEFLRKDELPGVEVCEVRHSARRWRGFTSSFEIIASSSWCGEVIYKQCLHTLRPGMIFCAQPGESYATPRVHRAGSRATLSIEPAKFFEYLSAHRLANTELSIRRFTPLSHQLAQRFVKVLAMMRGPASGWELQSGVCELVEALILELVSAPRAIAPSPAQAWTVDRIREYSDFEAGTFVDLRTLAAQTGLSRFQVLRAFKRKYGLPPHAYQLCVRISSARKALRAGAAVKDVAATHGFVDQSHFARTFKQLVGVTPANYQRAAPPRNWVATARSARLVVLNDSIADG
ncbi:MAG TPA: AraC family transcriptional regulator [Polyangiaceae bacterium]|nr:AraC family transcriptional regulator [Polyangiaceae bacterium]